MFVSWKIGEKGKKIDGYVCSMRMQRKEDEKKKIGFKINKLFL